ncbi:hypothetical protein ACT3RR_22430 [Ewingella sp. AOP8-B2-18]
MNTEEVKALIEDGEDSAYILLWEACPTAERKFKRLTKGLVELLEEVKKSYPEASYYTASGGFNLLLGDTHLSGGAPNQELVALSAVGLQVGDGDW